MEHTDAGIELSDEQLRAVMAEERYVRVIAGAGTGKTETLVSRIIHLIKDRGVPQERVVAFTYTERAAAEMLFRVYERTGGGGINAGSIGKMFVGTIHSFCFNELKKRFGYDSYTPMDEGLENAVLMRFLEGRYDVENFKKVISIFYEEMLDRKELKRVHPEVMGLIEEYEEYMEEKRLIDFPRMLSIYHSKLKEGYRPEIEHLLVDEFQDINRLQFEIIRLIGKSCSVFVVGDPRQTIYRWRCSDPSLINEFERAFPGTATYYLTRNRRSVPEIVRLANSIDEAYLSSPRESMLRPVREERGTVSTFSGYEAEIAETIEKSVKGGGARYSDFAVLYRSVKGNASGLITEFRRRDIPFVIFGNSAIFSMPEMEAIRTVYKWFVDASRQGGDPPEKEIGILSERFGRPAEVISADLARAREKFRRTSGTALDAFSQAYKMVYAAIGIKGLDSTKAEDHGLLLAMASFSKMVGDFEQSVSLGGRNGHWKTYVRGLLRYLSDSESERIYGISADENRVRDAVTVSTIHSAKGLEWNVVFLPDIDKLRSRPSRPVLSKDLYDHWRYSGGGVEHYNLAYVAVTRARDTVMFVRNRIFGGGKNSSEIRVHGSKASPRKYSIFDATSISDYYVCPHHYYLGSVCGFVQGTDRMKGFGESVHRVLKAVASAANRDRLTRGQVRKIVEREVHLPYATPEDVRRVRQDVEEKVMGVLDYLKSAHVQSTEDGMMHLSLGTSILRGRTDLLVRPDSESIEVIDYKSNLSGDGDDMKRYSMQLAVYRKMLEGQGMIVRSVKVLNLRDGKLHNLDAGPKIDKELEKCIAGMSAGEFRGRPCAFCGECEYRDICRFTDTDMRKKG